MIKKLVGLIVVLLVVLGGAFWWLVLRDDPEPELSLDSGSDTSQTTTGTAPENLDGTWKIASGGDTTAGFRIEETFGGGVASHTAVGRSTDVNGSIDVAGNAVTKGEFTVDLTSLSFTDTPPGLSVANRAYAMRDRGLQTATFPGATFELTAPIDFGGKPAEGETVAATATGNLNLHGVTNEVSFEIEAQLAGNTIRVATAEPVPVVLADYDIEKPTGGPIASIEDEGSFEFLVVFTLD